MHKFVCGIFFGFGLFGSLLNLSEGRVGVASCAFLVCVISTIGLFFFNHIEAEFTKKENSSASANYSPDNVIPFKK